MHSNTLKICIKNEIRAGLSCAEGAIFHCAQGAELVHTSLSKSDDDKFYGSVLGGISKIERSKIIYLVKKM